MTANEEFFPKLAEVDTELKSEKSTQVTSYANKLIKSMAPSKEKQVINLNILDSWSC